MNELEEDIKIIKNHYVFTTNHVLDDENKRFKQAIENLINKNKELRQEVAEHERREGQQNQNMVSALEEAFKHSLEIKDLEIKNKELEKMVELMAKELAVCGGFDYVEFGMSTGDFNKDIKNMIDYFKKKASEENG